MELASLFAQVAVPEATPEAMSYYRLSNLFWILEWALIFLVPLLLLVTGFSAKMASFSKRLGKNWFFSLLVYLLFFVAIYQLANLPLDFAGGYLVEHAYGLSTQSLGRWLGSYGKSSLLLFLGAFLFVWLFYLFIKKSPRRWWVYSGLFSTLIGFILTFIYPLWIAPFFNEIGPIKDKKVEAIVLSLARCAGIEDSKVLEVDKSKDTTTGNAYVAGIGSSKQIVIWDTLIQEGYDESCLAFIMGHEIGHFVLHHSWWGMLYFAILSFAISYLTYKTAGWALYKYRKRLRFNDLSDIASFPLLFLAAIFFYFLFLPLSNAVSCYMEREADRFGIEITHNNEAAALCFAKALGADLANPRPGIIYKIWRQDHPSRGDRIDFCNNYHPWTTGAPLKYGNYFKNCE